MIRACSAMISGERLRRKASSACVEAVFGSAAAWPLLLLLLLEMEDMVGSVDGWIFSISILLCCVVLLLLGDD